MNLLIRNVRLIDGTGADAVPKINVVVENGRVSWIGEGDVSPSNHPHYEDINAEDLTLVPGTFDCHEHFAGDGGRHGVRAMNTDPPELLLAKAAGNAHRALMTGQTSARDVGSPRGISITLARAVAAGALPARASSPPASGSSTRRPGGSPRLRRSTRRRICAAPSRRESPRARGLSRLARPGATRRGAAAGRWARKWRRWLWISSTERG